MSTAAVATAVRERPILFSSEMVRAILDGRKTQTRRVVKPGPPPGYEMLPYRPALAVQEQGWRYGGVNYKRDHVERCPYGGPEDRLWVREPFRQAEGSMSVHYAADPDEVSGGPWRPSIFMPRWASRLTLEITEVRVQRLQEITEEDAKAEGVTTEPRPGRVNGEPATLYPMTHVQSFIWAWNDLQLQRKDPSGRSWAANPWCWTITFRRVA